MNEPVWVVVPAAGTGERMGGNVPKQYVLLGGHCMLQHTLARLLQIPRLDGLVVVLSQSDPYWSGVPAGADPRVHTTDGGSTRADSVLAGLAVVLDHASPSTWVLVHDAARPLVSLSDIKRLTDAVYNSGAIGGLLAVPVQDTLKRAGEYGRVDATVSRERLWQAQTPQLFRAGELYDALQTAVRAEAGGSLGEGITGGAAQGAAQGVTDESSAMENLGHSPLLVEALQPNLKVTRPADLRLAALLLKADENASLDTSTS